MADKKFLFFHEITLCCFFTVFFLFAQTTELGDVNNDQIIDIIDALLVAQYYVGIQSGVFDREAVLSATITY